MLKRYKILILVLVVAIICSGTLLFVQQQSQNNYYTIVVLPDTQNYSSKYPEILKAQTKWIADNITKENIVFAVQVGDIVNNFDNETQWKNAKSAFDQIINKLPIGITLGNHDISANADSKYFNKYFPGLSANSFQLFSMGKQNYISLELSICPNAQTIQWANETLAQFKDRKTILTTHGYLDTQGNRNISIPKNQFGGCVGQDNNTQYIWDNLIKNNNIFLVLSGHMHGTAKRIDKNDFGQPVFQLLADYQTLENGGNGWMRLLQFDQYKKQIHVKTFSPYLNQYNLDTNNDFVLSY